MCDEIGENGTYHTHVYIALANGVRFNTLKNKFPSAHFELAVVLPNRTGIIYAKRVTGQRTRKKKPICERPSRNKGRCP
jgi:hypothetical protein